MKKFTMFSNYLFLVMAAAVLGLTACGDDPILGTEIPPSVSINGDVEVAPEGVITLIISGQKGDADMNLLSIKEDGVLISLDTTLNNPDIGSADALLIGDNASDFNFTVEVRAPLASGTYVYSATVTDVNGKTDEATVDVIVNSAPPTISYAGPASLQIEPNSNPIFNISATPGSSDLSTIAVYNSFDLLDSTQLEFNGVDFDTNPYFLVGDDVSGFDMADVLVRLADVGTYNLRFEVTDANGEMASTEVAMEVVEAGTPITDQYQAVLLSNADGPAGILGGLDLDNGANVSVNDDNADVIDLGLDLSTGEWRQQIQGANGTTLRAANTNNPELFNFANINSREAIVAAYDSGLDATPSEVVIVGNVFMANRGNDYFIMTVTEINPTNNNNEDSYLFDIKASN